MCESKNDTLIDLLHEIMRHCYYHDGDARKIALMERWRVFYDVWTAQPESEAEDD